MKLLKALLATFALALPVTAQTQCGLPGVTVDVQPAVATPGQPITVTLTNGSNSLIQLPSSCTIEAIRQGSGCTGPSITATLCLQVITPIQPGASRQQDWNQLAGLGQQVPDGVYSIEVVYWDANFSQLQSCCTEVLIQSSPGQPFCAGGPFGFPCPCGNPSSTATGGCGNSTGLGALLDGTGLASIGADSVVLSVSGCPAGQPGLFFSGPNALAGVPFGDGLRCVGGTVVRLGVVNTDASGNASTPWTLSTQDTVAAGDLRHYQYWYRDPVGSPCGAFFNTSNGYSIQW